VGIVAWIVLGAIAGFITNLIMGGGEGVIARRLQRPRTRCSSRG
jgi:uncharacterized membrane protein YeaQ/YmgE (transglycosylase-associated protein family)